MKQDVAGGAYQPFWVGFPLTDIHRCIAPDVLHQLYQGVLKYIVLWVQKVMTEEELDQRICSLPPASGVRHFKNGISGLSQVSGVERKHITRIILSCVVGKIHPRGITACRSLLHFIHLAQYPSHDEDTLSYMLQELNTWHDHRSYFIQEKVREEFNIPKFHSLLHYVDSIRWIGSLDNTNTEMFERLHIDFAKEGWRASNKRDHFPQMVRWLDRQEKIASYDFFRSWLEDQEMEIRVRRPARSIPAAQNTRVVPGSCTLTRTPAEPRKSLSRIVLTHLSPGFIAHLKLFLNDLLPTDQRGTKAEALAGHTPFTTLDIWHQFKLRPTDIFDDGSEVPREIIKAIPTWRKALVPRFDTVIVLNTDEAQSTAVKGTKQPAISLLELI
ncbi:hypothetical protein C8R42DRAFT_572167 [Lentinula raphanica]|nr:hypothetical protein C8R42DRAFT_598342 [Lentinula raphanica]KAJ3715641.1 hypothetical protein C8R42DRAFT_589483 [Lentinula raphanica]KAJ3727852.1 hypothetical protein C8R42DRAFT_572167 [Lentinula raphanica]